MNRQKKEEIKKLQEKLYGYGHWFPNLLPDKWTWETMWSFKTELEKRHKSGEIPEVSFCFLYGAIWDYIKLM